MQATYTPTKKETKDDLIAFRMPSYLTEQIDSLGGKRKRSVVIRAAIEKYLEDALKST